MNKKHVMLILSPIIIVILIIGLYVWSHSGIEGKFQDGFQYLDGSNWIIELKGGAIYSYKLESHSSINHIEIGSYKVINDNTYLLRYDKGRYAIEIPREIKVSPCFERLVGDISDLSRLDVAVDSYKRLHFWDFW